MNLRLLLVALSNFLTALGAGAVAATSLGITTSPWLKGDAILSFLIGPLVAITFIALSSKWLSTRRVYWLSIAAAVMTTILLILSTRATPKLAGASEWLFFVALSLKFCFVVVARSFRVKSLAGQKMRLSWSELAYYLGIMLGIAIWPTAITGALGLRGPNILIAVLIADTACLVLTAYVDFVWAKLPIDEVVEVPNNVHQDFEPARPKLAHWSQFVSISIVLICVTASLEAICFWAVEKGGATGKLIWSASYLGPAIGAIICGWFSFEFKNQNKPILVAYYSGKKWETPYSLLVIPCFLVFHIAVLTVLSNVTPLVCAFITAVGFLAYEMISLTLLDKLGSLVPEESKMVAVIYCLMYGAAAICTWILVQLPTTLAPQLMVYAGLVVAIIGVQISCRSKT